MELFKQIIGNFINNTVGKEPFEKLNIVDVLCAKNIFKCDEHNVFKIYIKKTQL